jgi:hypothetical protein
VKYKMTKKFASEIRRLTRDRLEKAMVREAELRWKAERQLRLIRAALRDAE